MLQNKNYYRKQKKKKKNQYQFIFSKGYKKKENFSLL